MTPSNSPPDPPREMVDSWFGVPIVDTFAEAFGMTAARILITADTPAWAETAARLMSGYGTSVIACDAEAALERPLDSNATPDGRPGWSVLAFAFSRDALQKALTNRVGQCVMTCPTTACFSGLPPGDKAIAVGGRLRYFGDGWQISKKLPDARRYWRIPVMDGEFLCEDLFGTTRGVAGGNLILLGAEPRPTLAAAEAAVAAIRTIPDVVMPFPGGIARSGSKVGSKYKALKASTNTAFTPTLRGMLPTEMPENAHIAYEIVIDGLTLSAVEHATAIGLKAAAQAGDLCAISAGNYGGKLGPHHIRLREVVARHTSEQTS